MSALTRRSVDGTTLFGPPQRRRVREQPENREDIELILAAFKTAIETAARTDAEVEIRIEY